MAIEEIFRYIFSFLGGGLVLAIFNWAKEARSASRQREITYLQDQLRLVYGPLHCFIVRNREIATLMEKLQNSPSCKIEAGPNEEEILARSGAETLRIVGVVNAYSRKLKENNTRIKQILEANWHLIDVEDMKPFLTFLVDCDRMQVEVDEKHPEGVDLRVNQQLGRIYVVGPEFVTRVTDQWTAKRERLAKLMLPRRWPRPAAWLGRKGD